MGEILNDFGLEFNGSVKLEARAERLTSEAGAVLLREVDERLGLTRWLGEMLTDTRDEKRITHSLRELVRTDLLLLGQGWRDHDDADALRRDAALRLAVSDSKSSVPLRGKEGGAEGLASQPTLSRLTAMLAREENRKVLHEALVWQTGRRLRAQQPKGQKLKQVTVDVDGLPVEVHGHQEGSAYNGHYGVRMYHPIVASLAETGDLLDVRLREGNVHSANGALEFIDELLGRVEKEVCEVAAVRFDAGFPEEKLLAKLEERGTPYVARVRNTSVLQREAALPRFMNSGVPLGEPGTHLYEWEYQAQGWSRARRVVLVVLERKDELFPHAFWLVTSWSKEQMPAQALLEHYRQRGTAEGHFGELMDVLAPALSSARRPKSKYRGQPPVQRAVSIDAFANNEVRLLLNALAYNLVHAARVLMEQATGEGWGLLRVRERVLKVAARVLLHARRVVLVIGRESASLWQKLWTKLGSLSTAQIT
ncbi:IS1380 family transposase [Archangium violaceum]|uniref:IS1380 family transposase n=2 Tax=Archangium violaceum TaxID=83451 RepID=UPI00193B3D98|nr:IS1380 family transposase [Archangium violaceum]QRK12332.1 IS1380 family transposase [Archangium violaceum]QRK13375.1 IS1380 family transposase [Archangium violaceum]